MFLPCLRYSLLICILEHWVPNLMVHFNRLIRQKSVDSFPYPERLWFNTLGEELNPDILVSKTIIEKEDLKTHSSFCKHFLKENSQGKLFSCICSALPWQQYLDSNLWCPDTENWDLLVFLTTDIIYTSQIALHTA